MDDNLIGGAKSLFNKKVVDILTLISRELHDLTKFLVFHNTSVATPCLDSENIE
jgi:hypothetical protein